ncbi:MAG: SAM-dependent chlorinase/fluorinase [Deltaproteobacteria bacterium]|nr:SAM-dependent chlorinase/fluorinase [Deltaproteobacteria bacterium]
MPSIITLTTDFGLQDSYVGEMKGVIYSINPPVNIVDISHMVEPQNVLEGALLISNFYHLYPRGTIHVAVVDPGVGSERRGILIETEKHLFIGPDNGLFTLVLKNESIKQIIELSNKDYFRKEVSATFHGRDIFAPVAAHAGLGIAPGSLGNIIDNPQRLSIPAPFRSDHEIVGEILFIDAFGNATTNIRQKDLAGRDFEKARVVIDHRKIKGIKRTYSDVEEGEPLLLMGSSGCLEIAMNQGDAAEELDLERRDKVKVFF